MWYTFHIGFLSAYMKGEMIMQRRKDNKGRVLKDGESYRKSDGLYMYRWTTGDGKRHTIYDPSLDGLREKEDKINKDMSDGIRVGEKNVTVNDVFELWKDNKKGLKKSTRGNYIYMYEQYVKDGFGDRRIQTLKKSDVLRFYNKLIDNNGLALNTIESIHTVLHQVFQRAVDDDYIRKNLTEGVLNECKAARNYEKPKRHALTIKEQSAFVEYIKATPQYKHWLPLFTFFLGTGCRVSEVTGLCWKDVDFKNNVIKISQGLVYYDREQKRTYHYLSLPKTTAGTRYIPMLEEVRQALLDEKAYQKEAGIKCNMSVDGRSDFVFLNRFGCVHNPQTINRTIKRVTLAYNLDEAEKAEKEKREPVYLPNFSCHNLRHTFATRFCENETNLKVIQSILGHKDIATTMDVYAEATREKLEESFTNLQGKIKIS